MRDNEFSRLYDSNNEFCFLVFDEEKNNLFLGRDKIGSKPLFFAEKRNNLVVCSERHELLKKGYSGVRAVNPGSLLKIDLDEKEVLKEKDFGELIAKDRDFRRIEELGEAFRKKFLKSLERRTRDIEEAAVAFSGGVDSSFLSSQLSDFVDVKLFTIGLKESHDLKWSKKASSILGLDHEVIELSFDEIKENIEPTLEVVADANRLKVGVGLPFYVLSKNVTEEDFSVLFTGQGSDELFLGYDKYRRADDPKEKILFDVKHVAEENIERDEAVCMENGVEVRNPYLDGDLIDFALNLPYEINLPEKRVVRKAAKSVLPKKIWRRDKKSVQYGTKVDREIDRVARRKGFKRKVGNHVDKYLASVAEEIFPQNSLDDVIKSFDD